MYYFSTLKELIKQKNKVYKNAEKKHNKTMEKIQKDFEENLKKIDKLNFLENIFYCCKTFLEDFFGLDLIYCLLIIGSIIALFFVIYFFIKCYCCGHNYQFAQPVFNLPYHVNQRFINGQTYY